MGIYTIIGVSLIVLLVALHINGVVSGVIAAYGGIGIIVMLCLGAVVRKLFR